MRVESVKKWSGTLCNGEACSGPTPAQQIPGTFTSPTGREEYSNVVPLQQTQVVIQRRANGYTVEARFNRRSWVFTPSQ